MGIFSFFSKEKKETLDKGLSKTKENVFTNIISKPGLLLQRLTTKEPDDSMIEVGIASVEAVFDWKSYLKENFGYDEGSEDDQQGNS